MVEVAGASVGRIPPSVLTIALKPARMYAGTACVPNGPVRRRRRSGGGGSFRSERTVTTLLTLSFRGTLAPNGFCRSRSFSPRRTPNGCRSESLSPRSARRDSVLQRHSRPVDTPERRDLSSVAALAPSGTHTWLYGRHRAPHELRGQPCARRTEPRMNIQRIDGRAPLSGAPDSKSGAQCVRRQRF